MSKRMADCHTERAHYALGRCYQCWASNHRKTSTKYKAAAKRRNQRWLDRIGGRGVVHRLQRYGITADQVTRLNMQQHGKCRICLRDWQGNEPYVDHDHSTGIVRALLCQRCNAGIGFMLESEFNLQRAVAYLRYYQRLPSSWYGVRFVDLPVELKPQSEAG